MKKQYISPLVTEVNVETSTMLAASIALGEDSKDAGASWSNERRGEWGNIWK